MTDSDDSKLEQQLREALRPVDPPDQFAERVTSAAERARASAASISRRRSSVPWSRSWLRPRSRLWLRPWFQLPWLSRRTGLSAAATVVLVAALAGGGTLWHQHARQLRAHEARDQILRALSISSQTLNTALRMTADPSRSG